MLFMGGMEENICQNATDIQKIGAVSVGRGLWPIRALIFVKSNAATFMSYQEDTAYVKTGFLLKKSLTLKSLV